MKAEFYYYKRKYTCCIIKSESSKELRISNEEGEVIAIEQGKKFGLQGKRRESSRKIDVSQPYFYNLIKAAISALEIVEKNQLLIEKERIIDSKNKQINILNQKLNIIEQTQSISNEQKQKLAQLQNSMQEQESIIEIQIQRIAQLEDELNQLPQILPIKQIQKKIISKLGNSVWESLHPSSQRELCHAYRNYLLIKSDNFTGQIADYKTAGHPLGIVAEREIVAPFFKELYQFLYTNSTQINVLANTFEIGGITLRLCGEYTLGNLPILLSSQWETFTKNGLKQINVFNYNNLYCTVNYSNKVSEADRELIKQFLQQWQHPLSQWMDKGEIAASRIDQIRKLRNIADHPGTMYLWQFDMSWSLLIGSKNQQGVLQEIYGNLNSFQNNSNPLKRETVAITSPPQYSNAGIF